MNWRLRDWGVSRQRYWGCPIPVIHCDACGAQPVPENQLPVKLPDDVDFSRPGNPLDHHPAWKHVDCPACGEPARRETDTCDTFVDSSWYFARFCSPRAPRAGDARSGGRLVAGGPVHRRHRARDPAPALQPVLHAGDERDRPRFGGRALRRAVHPRHGTHESYRGADGRWLYPEEVERGADGAALHRETREAVTIGRVEAMSKSKRNTVDPGAIIERYGADTARWFILSDNPPERDMEWTEAASPARIRFTQRLYRLVAGAARSLPPPGTLGGSRPARRGGCGRRRIARSPRSPKRWRPSPSTPPSRASTNSPTRSAMVEADDEPA